MDISREELKELILQAVEAAVDEHPALGHNCHIHPETMAVLNDKDTMEVIRTIGKGLTPNSASTLTNLGRMLDQVAFSLGTFILRIVLVGGVAVVVYLFFKKIGIELNAPSP